MQESLPFIVFPFLHIYVHYCNSQERLITHFTFPFFSSRLTTNNNNMIFSVGLKLCTKVTSKDISISILLVFSTIFDVKSWRNCSAVHLHLLWVYIPFIYLNIYMYIPFTCLNMCIFFLKFFRKTWHRNDSFSKCTK